MALSVYKIVFSVPSVVSVVKKHRFASLVLLFLAGVFFVGCAGPEIVYVSCTPDKVAVVDTELGRIIKTIYVGQRPRGIAFLPDGKLAFVANSGSDTVSVIDTALRKVVKTIPVGSRPNDVAITPEGEIVLVTCSGSNALDVIDVESLLVLFSIPVGAEPMGVALSKDGYTAYVADSESGTLSIVSTASFERERMHGIGGKPMDVALLPDGRVVVADGAGEAFFLDGKSLEVLKRVPFDKAWGVTVK